MNNEISARKSHLGKPNPPPRSYFSTKDYSTRAPALMPETKTMKNMMFTANHSSTIDQKFLSTRISESKMMTKRKDKKSYYHSLNNYIVLKPLLKNPAAEIKEEDLGQLSLRSKATIFSVWIHSWSQIMWSKK